MDNQHEDHVLVVRQGEHVNPIAFGRVLGRLDSQDESIKELKDGQKETLVKLDKLLEYQAKQRGAASVAVMMSTAVAAIVGWLVSWFTVK